MISQATNAGVGDTGIVGLASYPSTPLPLYLFISSNRDESSLRKKPSPKKAFSLTT